MLQNMETKVMTPMQMQTANMRVQLQSHQPHFQHAYLCLDSANVSCSKKIFYFHDVYI